MNIKAVIIACGKEYKTYDCELNVPSLKIETKNKEAVFQHLKQKGYTHVLFSMDGESIEVDIHKTEDGTLFANARQISLLDLNKFEKIKQNNLVKKYINNPNKVKKSP